MDENCRNLGLSFPQLEALCYIREHALGSRKTARSVLADILARTCTQQMLLDEMLRILRERGQVVLHFHPDRFAAAGKTVAAALLEEGCYQSQFVTGISNGSRSAFAGGSRDRWEARLFGGAYQLPGVSAAQRPKYGALDLLRHADGPAPRFGSCYLVLHAAVSRRCTFTYGDSHLDPEHAGTIDRLDAVMAALLLAVETEGEVLGAQDLTVSGFLARIAHTLAGARADPSTGQLGRSLDDYIEAQVHGPIDLKTDVELLVADPAFRDTLIGEYLAAICSVYPIRLKWHPGFILAAAAVPADFRGPAMPLLAQRIADRGMLDAAVIGRAAASLHRQPELWHDWASYDETLQHLKQLWHVLVYCGTSAGAPG